MNFGLNEFIIAVVTSNKDGISPGSMTPIFYAKDENHLRELALKISKPVKGMVHEVDKDTYIIVKH